MMMARVATLSREMRARMTMNWTRLCNFPLFCFRLKASPDPQFLTTISPSSGDWSLELMVDGTSSQCISHENSQKYSPNGFPGTSTCLSFCSKYPLKFPSEEFILESGFCQAGPWRIGC